MLDLNQAATTATEKEAVNAVARQQATDLLAAAKSQITVACKADSKSESADDTAEQSRGERSRALIAVAITLFFGGWNREWYKRTGDFGSIGIMLFEMMAKLRYNGKQAMLALCLTGDSEAKHLTQEQKEARTKYRARVTASIQVMADFHDYLVNEAELYELYTEYRDDWRDECRNASDPVTYAEKCPVQKYAVINSRWDNTPEGIERHLELQDRVSSKGLRLAEDILTRVAWIADHVDDTVKIDGDDYLDLQATVDQQVQFRDMLTTMALWIQQRLQEQHVDTAKSKRYQAAIDVIGTVIRKEG